MIEQENISRVSEGDITYWSPTVSGQPAKITKKFTFDRPIAEAFLDVDYIYIDSFAGTGRGSLWASKDGINWVLLVDAPTSSFAAGYGFNNSLPQPLMGSKELWIQARLQSDSGWTIMSQFLRYDTSWRTNNCFDLKIRLTQPSPSFVPNTETGLIFLDSDGDGQTDATELAAGTDPYNPNSRFTLSLSTAAAPAMRTQSTGEVADAAAGQGIVLTWSSVPGKVYKIQKSTDLRNWSDLSEIPAEPAPATQTRVEVISPDPKAFYRIGF